LLSPIPAVIRKFFHYYLPWSVNSPGSGRGCLSDGSAGTDRPFYQTIPTVPGRATKRFMKTMNKSDKIRFFDSTTSFILAKLTGSINSGKVCDLMARQRILIRNCQNFTGLSDQFIRISLKTSHINQAAAEKLLKIVNTEGKDNP
jgi:threonine-phosphate decarboxylase